MSDRVGPLLTPTLPPHPPPPAISAALPGISQALCSWLRTRTPDLGPRAAPSYHEALGNGFAGSVSPWVRLVRRYKHEPVPGSEHRGI